MPTARFQCCPLVLALLLLLAPSARADGTIFTTLEQPTIPTQSALIAWDGTHQTLAIETTFSNPGAAPESRYAWVVPVPSEPELKAATTGLFPTLRAITGPRIDDGRNGGLWLLLPAALLALAVWMLVWLPFPVAGRVVAAGFAVIVLGIACMPMFSRARSMQSVASADVEVLSAQPVGSYDTAVIRSDTGDAIAAWLTDAGFTIPPEARPVLDAYAKEGWCFVAARLRAPSSAPADRIVPHPIAMTFKADAPIYPMRLTGVGASADLQLDLYIFADQRAHIPGFAVLESARTHSNLDDAPRFLRPSKEVVLGHAGLIELAGGLPVATRLRHVLSPQDMTRDIAIGFIPFTHTRAELFTRPGALVALAPAASIALVVLSLLIALARVARARWATCSAHILIPVSVAALILLSGPVLLPVVKVTSFKPLWRHAAVRGVVNMTASSHELSTKPAEISWEAWLRRIAAQEASRERAYDQHARPIIEEDSPGNYTIRSLPDGRAQIGAVDAIGRVNEWLTVPHDDNPAP